jgi:hypothetical protein
MICFKDKTFCASDCVNSDCWRYFGAKGEGEARRWWSKRPNETPPVAFADFSRDCPEYKKPANKKEAQEQSSYRQM